MCTHGCTVAPTRAAAAPTPPPQVYVMTLSYAVVSPLIIPFGALFFALIYPVWRYQVLYVFQV